MSGIRLDEQLLALKTFSLWPNQREGRILKSVPLQGDKYQSKAI
jgi:hypothetical protein